MCKLFPKRGILQTPFLAGYPFPVTFSSSSQVIQKVGRNPSGSFYVYLRVSPSRDKQPACIQITASSKFTLLSIFSPPHRETFSLPVSQKRYYPLRPQNQNRMITSDGLVIDSNSQPLMELKPRWFSASLLLQRELRLLPHWSLSWQPDRAFISSFRIILPIPFGGAIMGWQEHQLEKASNAKRKVSYFV